MLYNEHCKAAKELQRKAYQLKVEGKDPSLPQKAELPKAAPPRHASNPYAGPSRVNTSSPQPIRPMSDSQNTGDESFMLLGGQRVRHFPSALPQLCSPIFNLLYFQSDPGDAFNQFWNIMQGMLDNLSQPVAFATVPLNGPEMPAADTLDGQSRPEEVLSSDTDPDEPIFSKFTRKIGMGREGGRSGRAGRNRAIPESSQQPTYSQDDDSDFEDFLEEGMLLNPDSCASDVE